MQNHKPHSQKAPQTGHSIFGTILFSLLAVLAVEFLLLTFAVHATRLGPQLNQNAEDILAMQVDNRSRYLQSIFHDAQELTSLSDAINGLTQQLLDEGEISLSTLDSSSDAAYPLLEAAAPELISTLRIKSVTGVFLILNTHDLDKRKQDSLMPAIYLRDLDPDAAPSQRNADLTFVRAPAQLVQSLSIATDNSWAPTIRYRALGNRGFLYPPFQAAYQDGASLAASDYGHWTSQSYLVPGDTHEAIAYSQPLILPDGTVYGVIGVELLADYLWENLPCSELQNNGTYFLAVTDTEELSASELQLRPVLRSHCDGQPGSADESLTLRLHSAHTHRYLFSNALYIASVSPLNLYSRNAPFSGKHWLLVGSVPAVQLFAFAQRLKQLFSFIMLITLAVGFVCSWLISRRLARPVAKLSAEVAAAEADSSAIPHLSATGIRELDQFSSAFTQLSKDVLDSSTRFLRIMKLASAELGGYELRDDSVYVTDNFFSMLGLAQEQPDPLTPKAFRALMGTLEQRWFYRLSPANNKVFAIPQPDGSTHYITLRITHILGESVSEVGLAEDMTTTVLEQQRIEHERDYDTLTGLYRRRAFDRACEALFQQPEKLGCAALLMMDLDNLKQINDTYGHDWGDQYIRQTGQCFAANTPANTICSRLSGDEFLIFFYGYQDQAQLRAQLELLSAALQRSVSILPNGKQLHISISGGIAWYPTDGHELLTLKKYADFAMYQVKHSHKGRMCDFDIGSYHQEAYAAQTQQDFELLLQEELVSYHFQPIYSARSGRVAAYEALMRVDLPTLHSPAQVMQLAHETGRLYEIERITVFHSSEIFQRLQAQGLLQSDALLFINSIANVSLTVEDVEEYAQRYPELLKRLVVEITEQEDLDRACLERKRNVPGFSGSFALDDYGSGYSSRPGISRSTSPLCAGSTPTVISSRSSPTLWLTPTPAVCNSSPRALRPRPSCAPSSVWAWTCCRATTSAAPPQCPPPSHRQPRRRSTSSNTSGSILSVYDLSGSPVGEPFVTPFRERRYDEPRIQFRSPRRHPGAGRAGAQPEEHRRRCAAPQDRRHCGRVRFRQVLAGAGCPLRRGFPPLSGGPFHLYPPPDDPGRKGAGGRDPLCSRRTGPPPAARRARNAFHLWHHDRAFEQPAADVLPAVPLPLPRLRLHGAAQPEHCGRDPALLPPVRRTGAGAGRGAVCL